MRTLLLTILFLGCISPFSDERVYSIPDELVYYYDLFVQDAQTYGIDYSNADVVVKFVDFNGTYAGKYYPRNDHIKQVHIDRDIYESHKNDTSVIKWLMYHELGHAFLDRNHSWDCNTIMYPYFMLCSNTQFRIKSDQMIEELFINR